VVDHVDAIDACLIDRVLKRRVSLPVSRWIAFDRCGCERVEFDERRIHEPFEQYRELRRVRRRIACARCRFNGSGANSEGESGKVSG
jgi:hypothetical protein